MNNYVPVLRHSLFFAGLGLFGLGLVMRTAGGLLTASPRSPMLNGTDALRFGAWTALACTAFAIVSLAWSYFSLPADLDDIAYFEFLFWAPGHVIQFTYGQIMLVAWLVLASATGLSLPYGPRVVIALLLLGAAPVIAGPIIQFTTEIGSADFLIGFTSMMQWGGGLAAVPLGLTLLWVRMRAPVITDDQAPLRSALDASLLVFAAGGLLGLAIHGVNTIIPAHYHGSIVGVTLALMGLTYHLLPRLGFRTVSGRMACWQPWIYACGQILHITGLALAGAMGIQRKTAGAAQQLDTLASKATMGLMGLGGLIAIIGGLLFLIVALRAMRPEKH